MLLLTGGVHADQDVERLRTDGANIIVATPGRLEDLFTRSKSLAGFVKDLSLLVLDEADRLLDLGFETSVNNILRFLPKQRRTGLFSATQTKQLSALVRAGLRNPVKVCVKVEKKGGEAGEATQSTPTTLEIL